MAGRRMAALILSDNERAELTSLAARRNTAQALALPDIQAKLKEGGNIATPTTPEGMRQQMAEEIANWKQIIEANNIKVN